MIAGADSGGKFLSWENMRIDLAPQHLGGAREPRRDLPERHVADHHEIDVAVGARFPARHRAENESGADAVHPQGPAEDLRRSGGFADEASDFREKRMRGVGAEVGAVAVLSRQDQADPQEALHLLAHRGLVESPAAGDLAKVQGGRCGPEEEPEDLGPGP